MSDDDCDDEGAPYVCAPEARTSVQIIVCSGDQTDRNLIKIQSRPAAYNYFYTCSFPAHAEMRKGDDTHPRWPNLSPAGITGLPHLPFRLVG